MLNEKPKNGRQVARLAGVALAALAAALLAPRAAVAGCGPRPMLPADAHAAADQRQPPAPQHHIPCRGPNCTSAPGRAPLAPAPPAPVPGDQYACLSWLPALPAAGQGARTREPSPSPPAGHTARVERPPRS